MFLIRVAVAALFVARIAAAQVATVDAGSFTITRDGARAGREEFQIRRAGTGEGAGGYVASATVTLAGRQMSPDLRADARGGVLAYRVDVTAGSEPRERLDGAAARGLFTAVVSTSHGEAASEYVVSDGAVILDDDVFHQYYFVALGGTPRSVAVVLPQRDVQVTMKLHDEGTESLALGGRTVRATHLVLTEPGGSRRDIWADAQGRVLKVWIPGRGVLAERDEFPR